ncbi:hypothetical protein JL37_08415 [Achromobacter sp. RTa]|uniref:hypothetical protein n=1 Tax=Achromobacter sp. RTa TaxID=1532557 RepID=UPI0005106DB1|nr:hypothetical protein [Achromobacter sp. RTa]KGD95812.1 hypothetical protein JL37_08415 [Achromobacter sp. RTa]
MPSRLNDPGIPTLTQRAEPTFHAPSTGGGVQAPVLTELADEAAQAYGDDAFPLLTDVAESAEAPAGAPASAALPDAAVVSARLQAEVEQLTREALADAIEQIQARMDAELPGIVARVLRDVRPG